MNNFHKNMTYAFSGGLICLVLATIFGPQLITKIFTPPLAYGIGCAPTGMWLMEKLIICQAMGLLFGIFFTIWLKFKFSGKKNPNSGSGCCS